MVFEEQSKEGEAARERALVARLRQFIEDSDLSFYKIASRVGTSGGILSMLSLPKRHKGLTDDWAPAANARNLVARRRNQQRRK